LIDASAAHLMVRANLNIIERAAMDDDTIYGRYLKLQMDMHQIMAGNRHENGKPGNGHGAPFASTFPRQEDPGPGPATPAPKVPIVVDGKEY